MFSGCEMNPSVFHPPDKTFSGVLDHDKLFKSKNGQSFSCKSESLLLMSSELNIKLVPLQFQAFTLPNGRYGKGERADQRPGTEPTELNIVLQIKMIFQTLKQ